MLAAGTEQRKLAAIMFTDMVGYSGLVERNEALALELLEEHRQLLRSLFPRFNGTEVKTIGDAFLVEFGSALEAAQCAIEIQRTLAKRNTDSSPDRQIQLRIGIHLGDVVHRQGDVYGDGVNIASRIEPLAGPGGICVSRAVFEQLRNKLEPPPVPLGEAALKNIQAPVEVYRVLLPWQTPGAGRAGAPTTVAAAARNHRPARSRRWAAAALVLLALATAVWWAWLKRPPRPPPRITSIAVRPVDDFYGDTNQAHQCDGMTDSLCSELGSISALRVPGRSTIMGYKGRHIPIRQLANELKVDAVLESSLQRASNRIRVTVQLVEAATDRHLWSDHYDRDLGDFFLLQSEIAQAVATQIKARLTPEDRTRLARARAGHPAAVEACLKGRAEWLKWTPEALTNAFNFYRQAINIDSNYPPAWSGLAACYSLRYGFYKQEDPEIGVALRRALSLDPDDPWAHHILGIGAWLGDFDLRRARIEWERAIQANPNEALFRSAHAAVLACSGELDDALRELDQASKLERPTGSLLWLRLIVLFNARRYEPVTRGLQELLAVAPQGAEVPRALLGRCYLETGRTNDALQELQAAVRAAPTIAACRAGLGYAYGVLGRPTEALQQLKALDELPANQPGLAPARATIHLGLGQTNQALTFLEQALAEKDPLILWLKVDPTYDRLRGDPRFQQLLQKAGLDK